MSGRVSQWSVVAAFVVLGYLGLSSYFHSDARVPADLEGFCRETAADLGHTVIVVEKSAVSQYATAYLTTGPRHVEELHNLRMPWVEPWHGVVLVRYQGGEGATYFLPAEAVANNTVAQIGGYVLFGDPEMIAAIKSHWR